MFRKILIGLAVLAAALIVAYVLLDRSADARLKEALDNAADDLPPGAIVTYDAADARVLGSGGEIQGLLVEFARADGRQVSLRAGQLDFSGYTAKQGGFLKKGRASDLRISLTTLEGEETIFYAGRLEVAKLALGPLEAVAEALEAGDGPTAAALATKLRVGNLQAEKLSLSDAGGDLMAENFQIGEMEGGIVQTLSWKDLYVALRNPIGAAAPADDHGKLVIEAAEARASGFDYGSWLETLEQHPDNPLALFSGTMAAEVTATNFALQSDDLRMSYDEMITAYDVEEDEDGARKETVTGRLSGFTLTSLEEGEDALESLHEIGYEDVRFDASWDMTMESASRRLRIAPFTMTLRDGGDFNLGMVAIFPEGVDSLTGVAALEEPMNYGLDEVSLEFVNAGLFERLLARKAEEEGKNIEQIKAETIAQIDESLQEAPEVAQPLKAFLRDPQRISVSLVLPKTLPMETLMLALMIQPRAIVENAEVTVSAN